MKCDCDLYHVLSSLPEDVVIDDACDFPKNLGGLPVVQALSSLETCGKTSAVGRPTVRESASVYALAFLARGTEIQSIFLALSANNPWPFHCAKSFVTVTHGTVFCCCLFSFCPYAGHVGCMLLQMSESFVTSSGRELF